MPATARQCCKGAKNEDKRAAESLRAQFGCLVDAPACSLMASPRVRAAGKVLAKLADAKKLQTFSCRALELLEAGQLLVDRSGSLNWEDLVNTADAHVLSANDRLALEAALRLVTIGTNDAIAFTISEGGQLPGRVAGLWRREGAKGPGQQGSAELKDAGESWGPMARIVAVNGSDMVQGLHVVAWERYGPDGSQAYRGRAELLTSSLGRSDSAYELRPGDVLHLAEPDRAAYLEVATFDRLPLSASLLLPQDVLELEVPLDPGLRDLGPELREARDFAQDLERLSPGERSAAKLARLGSCPVARQVLFLAERDADWSRVLPILSPLALRFYEAAESQLTNFWAAPRRLTPGLEGYQLLVVSALLLGMLLAAAVSWRVAGLPMAADMP